LLRGGWRRGGIRCGRCCSRQGSLGCRLSVRGRLSVGCRLSVRSGRQQQRDSDENPAHGRAHRTPSPKQGSWRPASPPSIRLPEPHARPLAVLGDELDAGRFERGAEQAAIQVRRRQAVFVLSDNPLAHAHMSGDLGSRPAEQCAGSAGQLGRDAYRLTHRAFKSCAGIFGPGGCLPGERLGEQAPDGFRPRGARLGLRSNPSVDLKAHRLRKSKSRDGRFPRRRRPSLLFVLNRV
jgi:hypothetical protein